MAYKFEINTIIDPRGKLSVIDFGEPFEIKRIYYIYDVDSRRGGHKHKITKQILICLAGSCTVYVNDGEMENIYILNDPKVGLFLKPEDWHYMDNFAKDSVLLVLASEYYAPSDYITTPY